MSRTAKIYGFGSYFAGNVSYNDIDILVVHESGEAASCRHAIACKRYLQNRIPKLDIVMLSQGEADGIGFLRSCDGLYLGRASEEHADVHLLDIAKQVQALDPLLNGSSRLRSG